MSKEFLLDNKKDRNKNEDVGFHLPIQVQQEGIITQIKAYQLSLFKQIFYHIFGILTIGLVYLLARWEIGVWIFFKTKKSTTENATHFVVEGQDKSQTVVKSSKIDMRFGQQNRRVTIIEFRLYRYYFDVDTQCFEPLEAPFPNMKNKEILDSYYVGIQNDTMLDQVVSKYGLNNTEIPDKGIFRTLIDEVLSPFYIFQFCSVILWFFASYQKYAIVILITSLISIVAALMESRNNFKRLQNLSKYSIPLKVYRGLTTEQVILEKGRLLVKENVIHSSATLDSTQIVPGDIIEITDNLVLPCDAILLNGQCIINESMLTGESIPVLKNCLQYSTIEYNPGDEGKQSTLFAGTLCMETKINRKGVIPVLALVTQTGFNTMKGQLIRSIMFPQSNSFKFYIDSMKFIGVMAVLAVVGFLCTLPNKIKTLESGDISTWEFINEGLDLITITVPPALPTCLQIGVSLALSRLQKHNIFCISPPKVNISGKITVMCFDKTGTLTEEGLDLYGLRPILYNTKERKLKFDEVYTTSEALLSRNNMKDVETITSPPQLAVGLQVKNKDELVPGKLFVEIMASCHGLAYVQGKLIGDPLEIKLFESTGWLLKDENIFEEELNIMSTIIPNNTSNDNDDLLEPILVLKRFEFSSKLQRMSVIVKSQKQQIVRVHVKGSPEKLRELCNPKTIPPTFHTILDFYAQNGFRVLALGSKIQKTQGVDIDTLQRENVEKDLTFLGFVIMENKLKPITSSVIEELHSANIRTIMVTGDNVLTAISVARQCNIIHANQRVFLGDLTEKKGKNGQYQVVWKDFEASQNVLDPNSLNPADDGAQFSMEEEDSELKALLKQEVLRLSQMNQHEKLHFYEEDYTKFMPKNNSLLEEPPPKELMTQMVEKSQCKSIRKTSDKISDHKSIRKTSDKISEHTVSVNISNKQYEQVQNSYQLLESRKQSNEELEQQIIEESDDIMDEIALPWKSDEDNYVLAVSGGAFNYVLNNDKSVDKQLIRMMLEKAQVYARMRPEEKALLMKKLQEDSDRKPLVGFCGDGANDCGALKGADVGVSLSPAEASIAAPFTSNIQDISCIPIILREGRVALTTSFTCFKFMAIYSMIQFSQVTILYLRSSNLTDNQYLYNDLITIFPLSMTMGFTLAYPRLTKFVPGGSLISFNVLSSVIGQTVIQIGFQLLVYFVLLDQSWFLSNEVVNAHSMDDDSLKVCYENTTLFLFGNFQYVATVLAFSTGKPFRKPVYTNKYLMISVVLLMTVDLFFLFSHQKWSDDLLGLLTNVYDQDGNLISQMPMKWIYFIAVAALANTVMTFFFERVIVPYISDRNKNRRLIQQSLKKVHDASQQANN